jgi:Domain of unknown function (DUF397)
MTAVDPSRAAWRTSSHSGANGSCVQITGTNPATVMIRDSTDPAGPRLTFTTGQWAAFTAAIKRHAGPR